MYKDLWNQEVKLTFNRFCSLSAIKEHLASSNYVPRTIQNISDAILKYNVQALRRKLITYKFK
jgi:hypothetical protein